MLTFGRRLALTMIGCLCQTSCVDGTMNSTREAQASALVVHPPVLVLRAGDIAQLTAQVNDARGHAVGGVELDYQAESTSILRVSHLGRVSAIGVAGRDSIVVKSGSLSKVVPVSVTAGPPRTIDEVLERDRTAVAGSTLSDPIVVAVRDAYDNPVPRASVHFVVESGGHVEPEVATADATGTARAMWTLGSLAGTQSLRAQAESAAVIIEAAAEPGPMARVEYLGAARRLTSAGDTISVRMRATDEFGNGVAAAVFAFSVTLGGGDATPIRVESDSTGVVETRWRTGTKAGLNTLRVRAFQVHDTTFNVTLRTVGGAPTSLELVSGGDQRARAGSAVRRPPVVRVVDRYGNPVASVRVGFSSASKGAEVEPAELVTDEQGTAKLRRWTLGEVGANMLLVAADGVPDTLRISARATAR